MAMTAEEIERLIREAMPDAEVEIRDLAGDGDHYAARIVSAAFALGSRHHVRNLFIAAALSLTTFYAFAIGLGVNLPAGVLQGIL